ncbi:MAG: alpha/beta hydrolase [Bacteroidetes bacterium]|nr:alpha/beta hydrolase [Bacteroidota bacterium]MBM3424410.1 alpha/beta hydrolase [Bacteroidota bacterium]
MLHHKILLNPNSSEWAVFIHGFGGSSNVWFKQTRAFNEHFNLLLIDLRGHRKSQNLPHIAKYSFALIAKDVAEVLEFLNIKKAHFIGLSLGSIIIRQVALNYPQLVKSMIFAGAVTQLDVKSRFFLKLGRTLQPILPHMTLYKLFANIIMPKDNHKESRSIFIEEAKQLTKKEFNRWFKLTNRVAKYLNYLHHQNKDDKALYIMGSEDHLFVGPAKDIVHGNPNMQLEIVQDCGHVVNVEQPEAFNKIAIEFIQQQA